MILDKPIYYIDPNGNSYQVQWGFFLENTLFRAFEPHNNRIIEQAHAELAHRVGNNYVDITDQVLGSTARVYFGVERIHLRMPGTRYYVERRLTSVNSPSRAHRWAPTATTRRSSVRQPRPSTSAPAALTAQQARSATSRRSSRVSTSATNAVRPPAKLSAMHSSNASTNTTKSISSSRVATTISSTNTLYAANEGFQIMPSISAPTLGYRSLSTLAQAANINGPESFDWEIIPPRLVHKASQEWSQASSSSSSSSATLPLSPLASPDFKRKKQDPTAKSLTSYPTPELAAAHRYTHESQQQGTAFLTNPSGQSYQQSVSSSMNSIPIPSFTVDAPRHAASVATESNLPMGDINHHMVNALGTMSISLSSQGIPQQANQDLFLMTPPMKESSMAVDQLPASDLSSYWVWPSTTTNVPPTFAAGTANFQTGTNHLPMWWYDENGQYTNVAASIDMFYH